MLKLSVILVAHNMRREISRTLQSLITDYQVNCENLDYEVLVIENGSTEKLDAKTVESFGPQFRYHYLQDPPPSPAYALNYGAKHSTGNILCFMIDGAHLLTPGVFKQAMSVFGAIENPVVLTRYFFLGPSDQNESVLTGYCKEKEDALLEKIDWPHEGYRLFEIGVPLQGDVPKITWFNKMIESNCLFMYRSTFERVGGADEGFDMPGGGFLNIDLCKEASDLPGAQPVQLIGEGSFHQIHGGTTTNVTAEERDEKVSAYLAQYRKIRGHEVAASEKDVYYWGHLPTFHSKIHMLNRPYNQRPVPEKLKNIIRYDGQSKGQG